MFRFLRLFHENLHRTYGTVSHALAHDVDALCRSGDTNAVHIVVNLLCYLLALECLWSVDGRRHLGAEVVEVEVVEDGPVVGDGSGTLDMIEKAENRLKAILK